MEFFARLLGRKDESLGTQNHLAISLSPEMIADEVETLALLFQRLEAEMMSCASFIPDKVPSLVAKMRNSAGPFRRLSVKSALAGNTYLSLEEKRRLGLNTRAKYTHEFIACCVPEGIRAADPSCVLGEMFLSLLQRSWREADLRKFRRMGIVTAVKIIPQTSGERPCGKIGRLRKAHPLDAVPDLPLPGCTAECCMCGFEPIFSDD